MPGRNDEMSYFTLEDDRTRAVWEAYRQQWLRHREALVAACERIGHPRVVEGFHGEILAVARREDGTLHPAFSPRKQARNGGYLRHARGKTSEEKAAVEELKAINEELTRLRPNPRPIAKVEGFLCSVDYKTASGGEGWSAIGDGLHPVQPLWLGMDQPIVLYAADAAVAIERTLKREGAVSTQPTSWEVPEGYRRLSKARYDLMVASYKVAKEEAKADGEEG